MVILNDDVRYLFEELVRSGRLKDVHIGLDFFDGTMNRVGAYAVGARSSLKGLLLAMLQPQKRMVEYERKGDYFGRMALLELCKTMPFGIVWDRYCEIMNAPLERDILSLVTGYEDKVLSKR